MRTKKQYPSKIVVYVTKYVATYKQQGEGLKEIRKKESIKETSRTFYRVLENPTTGEIVQTLDEIKESTGHGNTLEGGWREYNDFFNEFKHRDKEENNI